MLDCAVRCSTGRRLCAGLCCALQHQPEAVCWPVLVLQHTERLWRCQTQLCAVCTLGVGEKSCCHLRDFRCSGPVADLFLFLFVSSRHLQNTSFCIGDAQHASYVHIDILYSHAVPLTNVTNTSKKIHTLMILVNAPAAELSEASAKRMEERAATARRRPQRKC